MPSRILKRRAGGILDMMIRRSEKMRRVKSFNNIAQLAQILAALGVLEDARRRTN